MKILITGSAGFIGNNLALQLLNQGHEIIGIDCLDNYYDVELKKDRLARTLSFDSYTESRIRIENKDDVDKIFAKYMPQKVVNLAAQAGVRYSIENPKAYIDSNIVGFSNILEACRNIGVEHLVYASSSSVYGSNTDMPFSVRHNVNHPVSLYAASKKANELMAHSYSNLFHMPTTGLRFFTVYGPWGRPDMATFIFTNNIINGKPINIFNHGKMKRDFTYIDDIVLGIYGSINLKMKKLHKLYNLGNSKPEPLLEFVKLI